MTFVVLCHTCENLGTEPIRNNTIRCYSGPIGREETAHTRCSRYTAIAPETPAQCSICTHQLTLYLTDTGESEQLFEGIRCDLKKKIRYPGAECPDFRRRSQ